MYTVHTSFGYATITTIQQIGRNLLTYKVKYSCIDSSSCFLVFHRQIWAWCRCFPASANATNETHRSMTLSALTVIAETILSCRCKLAIVNCTVLYSFHYITLHYIHMSCSAPFTIKLDQRCI